MQVYRGIIVRTARMIGRLHEGLALGNGGRLAHSNHLETYQQLRSRSMCKANSRPEQMNGVYLGYLMSSLCFFDEVGSPSAFLAVAK
jgi:hypothetical protein